LVIAMSFVDLSFVFLFDSSFSFFFFFNDTATSEIYTLSLHDALPILSGSWKIQLAGRAAGTRSSLAANTGVMSSRLSMRATTAKDRKSTRLNSSHRTISYAVFCLKKKKKKKKINNSNKKKRYTKSNKE